MRALKLSLVLVFVGAFAAAPAAAAPITFSEFPINTVISNQYAPQGVTFAAGTWNLPKISNDGAMPGSPILRPDGGPSTFAGDFWMNFVSPVAWVSFQSGYWDGIGTAVIDVYSPGNVLLGSFTNTITGPENMLFSGLGSIGSVYFNSVADGAGGDIDNLDFKVPEPGTLALLGLGLLGLIARRRRQDS
jgi:hypothetical protein